MKTRNTKEFFVHPYKKTNIGRRTGKDLRAGKNIRKDADGYEIFEDYFSESDADLTLNQTAAKLSKLTTKENIENEAQIEEEENEKDVKEPTKLSSVSHIPVPCHKTSVSKNNIKDIQDVNPVAWIKNKQIGRRTGRNIKAGKVIRKDKDGYEIFEDYWSESEAESSVFSKSSLSTAHSERDKSLRKPLETRRPVTGSTFREEENPVAWIKNKNIGRRTGRNIKAGKNIRRDSHGYEKFEDYFSESEVDSLMESRINESTCTLEKSRRFSRKSTSIIERHIRPQSEDVTESVTMETSKQNSRHVSVDTAVNGDDHTESHLSAGLSPGDKNGIVVSETDTTQSSQNTTLSEGDTATEESQDTTLSEGNTATQDSQATVVSDRNNTHPSICKDVSNTQGSQATVVSDGNSTHKNISEDCIDTAIQCSQATVVSDGNSTLQKTHVSEDCSSQDSRITFVSDTNNTHKNIREDCSQGNQETVASGTNETQFSQNTTQSDNENTQDSQNNTVTDTNSTHVSQHTTLPSEAKTDIIENTHRNQNSKSDGDDTQCGQNSTTENDQNKSSNLHKTSSKETGQNRTLNEGKSITNLEKQNNNKLSVTDSTDINQSSQKPTLSDSRKDSSNNTERSRTKTTSKAKKGKAKSRNSGNVNVTDTSMGTDSVMLEEQTEPNDVDSSKNTTSAVNIGDTSCNTSRTQKRKISKTKKSTGKSKDSGDVAVIDESKTEKMLEEKSCISSEMGENICDRSKGEISQKMGMSKTRNTSAKTKEKKNVAVAKDGEMTHNENTENKHKMGTSKTRNTGSTDLSRIDKTDSSDQIENKRERNDNNNIVHTGHASRLHVTDMQKSVVDEDTPHLSWKAPTHHQPDGPTINIGGNVTGSITRCEDKTLHTTGVTPAISFRTRKRLSYSVAEVDETLHVMKLGRRSDPTSDCSIREDKDLREKVKKPKRSLLTKSLMMKTFQLDSDSDASIGFLSLTGPSNKPEDEDIVIVDTKNETKNKSQVAEKSRLSMKPGEQLEKSEMGKPTKTESRKSRKKSSVTVNVEDENVDVDSKLRTHPSKLKEEFEKEFDIISLESDESIVQKVTKNKQKGDKNKKVTKNRKSTTTKKVDQDDTKSESVIGENKTIQKKNGKVKGKNKKEKSIVNTQGNDENDSVNHVLDSENHLDSVEQFLPENIMETSDPGSLTKLQKRKLARKKSFMFDESEVESIEGVNTATRNSEQIETVDQNDVRDFDNSRMNSEDVDENLHNKTAPIQTKSRKGRRKMSVPSSLPRRRQQQKLSTPKSLPQRKRKISAQVETQAKTRKSALHEINNDKAGAIENLQKSRKISAGQNDGKDEVDKSQVKDKKTNVSSKKANKRSKKQESGKDVNLAGENENLDMSLEKKRKKSKASIAETPVSIRSQAEESPLPFEVSNIQQAFQSGVSFRHRSRISELNDSLQPNPLASPGDTDEVGIGLIDRLKQSDLFKTMNDSQTLTPCIVKPGNNRKSKGRRVTINNLTTQHTFIADVSGNSSDNQMADNTVNNNDTTSNSLSSTPPVHFFEVTNTETPIPVVAVTKKQIIFPSPAPEGLRRSKRNRVKPLEWHKNERIIYDRRKSGLVICGVEPSAVECKILEQEAKRKAKMKKRKGNGKPRQRLFSPARNLSLHVDLPTDMNVTVSSEIPVFNPESNEEVLLECVGTKDMNVFVGPTGEEPRESDPFLMSRLIDHKGVGNGFLLLRPKQDKPEQLLLRGSLMFILLRGKISVKINRAACIFEAEDTFLIPQGNKYSIKNLRSDQDAKLYYTVIKDVEKYSSSEEDEEDQENSN